jgi:hypothetical protein
LWCCVIFSPRINITIRRENITQHHNSRREHYTTSQFVERTLHNITIRRENITQHHNSGREHYTTSWSAYVKTGKWAVIYMCTMCINFTSLWFLDWNLELFWRGILFFIFIFMFQPLSCLDIGTSMKNRGVKLVYGFRSLLLVNRI